MDSNFLLGAGFSVTELSLFFQTIFAVFITLWFGWVVYNHFSLFASEKIKMGQFGYNIIRAAFLWLGLMVIIAL